MGYLPGMWHDFGVTTGSLAGALTGLLFVAVSIKSSTLAESRSLRSRAAQTLVLFMSAALYVLDRRGGHDAASRVARYIEVASPNAITSVLFGIAGLTFRCQRAAACTG